MMLEAQMPSKISSKADLSHAKFKDFNYNGHKTFCNNIRDKALFDPEYDLTDSSPDFETKLVRTTRIS